MVEPVQIASQVCLQAIVEVGHKVSVALGGILVMREVARSGVGAPMWMDSRGPVGGYRHRPFPYSASITPPLADGSRCPVHITVPVVTAVQLSPAPVDHSLGLAVIRRLAVDEFESETLAEIVVIADVAGRVQPPDRQAIGVAGVEKKPGTLRQFRCSHRPVKSCPAC